MDKRILNAVPATQEFDNDRECLSKICDESFVLLSNCNHLKEAIETSHIKDVSAKKFLSRAQDKAARLQSDLMKFYLELSDATLVTDPADLEIIFKDKN